MVKLRARGVTLVELLVVVSIIGVLALVATMYFRGQIFKGNDARRKSDIKRIQIAVEEYEKDHDCYPYPQLVTCNPGTGLVPYLSKVPCDPTTDASYYYEHEDSSCPRWYRIYAHLENEADTDTASLGCTNGCGPNYAYSYFADSPNAPAVSAGAGGGTGGGGGAGGETQFYGCSGSACVPVSWDPSRPGPACDPNYQSPTCYNQCGNPETQCMPWH